MKNNFLDHIFNLGNVKRFSNKRVVCSRSVAEHMFTVAHMVMIIGNEENVRGRECNVDEALRKAICHDIPESVTGDIIYPIKHYDEEIRNKLVEIEENAVKSKILSHLPKQLQELYSDHILNCKEGKAGKLVALCDMLDILYHCSIERVLGNQSVWVYDVFSKTEVLLQKPLGEFPSAKKYYSHIRDIFYNPQANDCGEEKSNESDE